MVKQFDLGIKVPIAQYKSTAANHGKVAIFDFDHSELIAEGDDGSDWFELEMLCEKLRDRGNFKIVIVPESTPSIKLFRKGDSANIWGGHPVKF